MRRTALMFVLAGLVGALVAVPVTVYASHQFTDVPNTNPFHDDIDWLADEGITLGCGTDIYCPKDNVTREQMAAFMRRLAESLDTSSGFSGYEVVTETRELGLGAASTFGSQVANCPSGKEVLGGGASAQLSSGVVSSEYDVVTNFDWPVGDSGWAAFFEVTKPVTTEEVVLTVYAICANT